MEESNQKQRTNTQGEVSMEMLGQFESVPLSMGALGREGHSG